MGRNSQKQPFVDRSNFVNLGANACNQAFSKAVRGCRSSAEILWKKSWDYNKRFKIYIGESWNKIKSKKHKR